ncbi:FGGY-family carbohydrate kinase [Raineyella fluvialis]|uniref:L-xylulokinase n=1 Tax=Raineyella fluvialis TaxID=2662261 RepID=A0A5Q2F7B2_9ACTN|nr:FGGY family carbohydrate kinase [Raineyella fluvialis]QGF22880.1 hypothetical protein Rai3103_03460 [Raineyella fluvialis]
MKADLVLAVDAGGSYVKATLFDLGQGSSTTVARDVRPRHPEPGWSERDAEELWAAASSALRSALGDADPVRVAAIGLTGHGNGAYIVDEVGRPTRPAVMAADTRARFELRRWQAQGVGDLVRERSWSAFWAGQPGPIVAWLSRHDPGSLARAQAVVSCKDYLRGRLTGRVESELTDASCNGLYDNAAYVATGEPLRVSEDLLGALGIEGSRRLFLPPTVSPLESRTLSPSAAAATGLLAGTPVVAGVVDNLALQYGSGVTGPEAICVGAGTWSVNQLLVDEQAMTPDGALGATRPLAACVALDHHALLSEASPTSASNLDWALHEALGGLRREAEAAGRNVHALALEREGERVPRLDDPVFLPYIDGSRLDSGARGAWLGLSSATTDVELVGAVIEGICFEHRRHVERLGRAGGAEALPVRLSGGATRSPVWVQRFADALGREVLSSPVAELGSVGAAGLAAVTVSVADELASVVHRLGGEWSVSRPDPRRRDAVEQRFGRYLTCARLLEELAWSSE